MTLGLGMSMGLSLGAPRILRRFDAGLSANLSTGLVTLPSWLAITCATTGRTTQTGAATLVTGLGANAARARDVGNGTGLSVEMARTNKLSGNTNTLVGSAALSAWSAYDATATPGQADPAGGTAAVRFVDTSGVAAQFGYGWALKTFGTVGAGVASGWSRGIVLGSGQTIYGQLLFDGDVAANPVNITTTAWRRISVYSTNSNANATQYVDLLIKPSSTIHAYGEQLELGKLYPSSYFPIANGSENQTRAADVLSVASPSTIAPGGFFDLDLTVAPNYADTEFAADHNLIYFDANNRVFVQQSTKKVVLRIGGADVLSSALTWSREQAIRVRAEHRHNGRRLSVIGATTGDGDSGMQSAASAISLPATAYLMGSNTGAEECADLRNIFVYRP